MSDTEQKQAERLIIENRNEDGSFDMKGIANDIVSLLRNNPTHQAEAKPVDGEMRTAILKHGNVRKCKITVGRKLYSNGTISPVESKTQDIVEIGIDDLMDIVSAHLQAAVADKNNEIVKLRADIAYAIGRFQGMEMDSAYLEQEYPEWKEWAQQLKQEES